MVRTLTLGLVLTVLTTYAEVRAAEFAAHDACTPAEKWEFAGHHPVRGFAEGLALAKKVTLNAAVRSKYAMGRAFFEAGVYGPAIGYFNAVVAEPSSPASVPWQLGAIACLARIHERYPVWVFTDETAAKLKTYFKPGVAPEASLPVLWHAAVHVLLHELTVRGPKASARGAMTLLKGAGHYEAYAKAIWGIDQDQYEMAETNLVAILSARSLPPLIQHRKNELRLILARLLYSQDRYGEAAVVLEAVGKQDNSFVQALTLRTWVELARGNYSEAVGASTSLHASALKNTFSPEALLVAAISLHELCQFPAVVRTVGTFKKSYGRTYQWLREATVLAGGAKRRLYPLAAAYLHGKAVEVPVKILSEWVRSPLFLQQQQVINVSFAQAKAIPGLIEQAGRYVARQAAVVANFVETNDEDSLHAAADRFESEESEDEAEVEVEAEEVSEGRSPASQPEKLLELQAAIALQENLIAALPVWTAELDSFRSTAFRERHKRMERIDEHFHALNGRMVKQLDEALANAEILEAETFERASQDMVWQHAHTDFTRSASGAAGKRGTWEVARGRNGKEEVWEDELGAMRASLQSQCPKPIEKRRRP